MPEFEADETAANHRFLHRLAGFRILEGIDGVDILEHEGQIEDLELLGEGLELRQGRRGELHIALKHRLKHGIVIVKRGVRIDLHAGLAVHFGVHPFGKQAGCDAFGVLVGIGYMGKFHDDFAIVAARCRQGGAGRHRQGKGGHRGGYFFHGYSSQE